MDIEFHYYITYLIAARAGFNPKDSRLLAFGSQYVDDNNVKIKIGKNTASFYQNYISQTMDIMKPKKKLFRIYPLFHFIPGKLKDKSSLRKDGKQHLLNTTPDSHNARMVMKTAMNTKDLYRLAIACHAYCDTFAHQNFIGYFDGYNAMSGILDRIKPNMGHVDAMHLPDRPAAKWEDKRLLRSHENVDNKQRFLDAAGSLFKLLSGYLQREISTVQNDKLSLIQDISDAIGEVDTDNENVESRIARYRSLSTQTVYGGETIPVYDGLEWFNKAISQNVRGLNDLNAGFVDKVLIDDEFNWREPSTYKNSHWFKFQEAVKSHQKETWSLLEKNVFDLMELESL